MLKACAFAPGHVTGFFEICDGAADIRQRGSRGAGICLTKGVLTHVEVTESQGQDIQIELNSRLEEAPVTTHVVRRMLGEEHLNVKVASTVELPQGQGFGLSGAGALSTAMALNKAMDLSLTKEEVVCIAHEAEIACGTGLGDVMPQSLGGIVVRKKEGCAPFGELENIGGGEREIVLCVIGEELSTRSIITDLLHKQNINRTGKQCLRSLLEDPGLERMMELSYRFSQGIGLMSRNVESALVMANKQGMASMAMLGNSVFAVGGEDRIREVLAPFGEVLMCSIDMEGASLVKGE